MRLKQGGGGQTDPVSGEKSIKKMTKEKHGQFYNWALNTPCNWGEVKWLRGY